MAKYAIYTASVEMTTSPVLGGILLRQTTILINVYTMYVFHRGKTNTNFVTVPASSGHWQGALQRSWAHIRDLVVILLLLLSLYRTDLRKGGGRPSIRVGRSDLELQ